MPDDTHHREDGPVIQFQWTDGKREWYLNGQLHREGGPAVEGADGERQWWLNGQLHREDGPAVEWWHGLSFRVPPIDIQAAVSHERGLYDRVAAIDVIRTSRP